METSLYPLALQLRAGTVQLRDAIGDLHQDQALTRVNGITNHAAYIALHLLDARCFLVRLLGTDCRHGFESATEGARSVGDIEAYPAVQEILDAWDRVTDRLTCALEEADEGVLASDPPFRFPVEDQTVLGAVAFLAHHEGYHLGQLGLIRRALGLGPLPFREG